MAESPPMLPAAEGPKATVAANGSPVVHPMPASAERRAPSAHLAPSGPPPTEPPGANASAAAVQSICSVAGADSVYVGAWATKYFAFYTLSAIDIEIGSTDGSVFTVTTYQGAYSGGIGTTAPSYYTALSIATSTTCFSAGATSLGRCAPAVSVAITCWNKWSSCPLMYVISKGTSLCATPASPPSPPPAPKPKPSPPPSPKPSPPPSPKPLPPPSPVADPAAATSAQCTGVYAPDTALKGGDYKAVYLASASQCCLLCAQDSKCFAWNWMPDNAQNRATQGLAWVNVCYMKGASGWTRTDAASTHEVSGSKTALPAASSGCAGYYAVQGPCLHGSCA